MGGHPLEGVKVDRLQVHRGTRPMSEVVQAIEIPLNPGLAMEPFPPPGSRIVDAYPLDYEEGSVPPKPLWNEIGTGWIREVIGKGASHLVVVRDSFFALVIEIRYMEVF